MTKFRLRATDARLVKGLGVQEVVAGRANQLVRLWESPLPRRSIVEIDGLRHAISFAQNTSKSVAKGSSATH
jgi:hypothetical protein